MARVWVLVLACALAGCSTLPEEMRPITDSLNTPEMNQAIREAQADKANRS